MSRKRMCIVFLTVIFSMVSFAGSGFASSAAFSEVKSENVPFKLEFTLNSKKALMDGSITELPAAPVLVNDTTMLPLRFIGESFGAEVKWENDSRKVILTTSEKAILLHVGEPTATVNGIVTELEQSPVIVNDTTLVPLRFIAESLNRTVMYDNDTKTISITGKDEGRKPPIPIDKPEAPIKEKLSQPSVDNLTLMPGKTVVYVRNEDGTGSLFQKESVSSFVADKTGIIYMIDFNSSRSGDSDYRISVYNQKQGDNRRLQEAVAINEKFNLEYTDKNDHVHKVSYRDIKPIKLFYDEINDKLYMLANAGTRGQENITVFYEILPEIKVITYHLEQTDEEGMNDFLTTLDGQTFFYSNTFMERVYTQINKERKTTGFLKEGIKQRLVSVVKDGSIYLLDQASKKISRVREDGYLVEVAQVNLETINSAAARDGYFYAADMNGFYRINTDGKVENYFKMDELIYNQGLYETKSGTYERMVPGVEGYIKFPQNNVTHEGEKLTGPLKLSSHPDFTVDNIGNLIIYDPYDRLLKRINIYKTNK
ncbi:copper amine oxidase N-terminal domain-containing protein [Paenibacillus chitinolyticus]|uniref:copper amine oxidase N-terminal domain-containing protein n=1 Tax=Paenibacillus chitinolyticus TaxID=79263 RepID=UPI003636F9EC